MIVKVFDLKTNKTIEDVDAYCAYLSLWLRK